MPPRPSLDRGPDFHWKKILTIIITKIIKKNLKSQDRQILKGAWTYYFFLNFLLQGFERKFVRIFMTIFMRTFVVVFSN